MRALTHLMFQNGEARDAAALYASLTDDAAITSTVDRDGNAEVRFTLAGADFIAFDSPVRHAFDFTPAMSVFLECSTAGDVDAAFERLAAGGQVLMPLASYDFSERFGWCTDRFGVSWQVALAAS